MAAPGTDPRAIHAAEGDDASPAASLGAGDAVPSAADPAARANELEERLRRALADLDNMRKRYGREIQAERAAERARVAAAWLPVIDNLDRALAHADDHGEGLAAGVRAVRDQAVALLAELGYPRDDETGVPFDPVRNEAVAVASNTDAEPGTVLEVVRPGYGQGRLQLRPAAVVVAGPRE